VLLSVGRVFSLNRHAGGDEFDKSGTFEADRPPCGPWSISHCAGSAGSISTLIRLLSRNVEPLRS